MKTIHTFGALSAAVREGFNLIVSKPSTFIVTVTVKGGDRARARAHASHVHASCVLEDARAGRGLHPGAGRRVPRPPLKE